MSTKQNAATVKADKKAHNPHASHQKLEPGSRQPSLHSIDVHVQADGARVVVLEVVEACVVLWLHLDGDGGASWAWALEDLVGIARNNFHVHWRHGGVGTLVVIGRALHGWVSQDAELDFARTSQGESRGLKLRLLGEQELHRADLALGRAGNVEVEDAADRAGGGAIERGRVDGLGLVRVDWDDQVRELEVLAQRARTL